MDPTNIFYDLIDKERNIYELASLCNQNRKDVSEFIQYLASPVEKNGEVQHIDNYIYCKKTGNKYPIMDHVIDFTGNLNNNHFWETKNKRFLNYHRSLSVYTLLNSTPLINYISDHSGIGYSKHIRVVDVGGGTGHSLCSFFQFPETIEYYLVDPNLRLLHDHFLRIYPKLGYLKMAHVLAYAEKLPFTSDFADLVFSFAAIDHYSDYRAFISEAYRILKPGKSIFIASHLDIPRMPENNVPLLKKVFHPSFCERVTRFLYYRRFGVGKDDHTFHFSSPASIEEALLKTGFKIDKCHSFKNYFYLIGTK